VENAEHINVAIVLDQIRDAIVTIEKNPHISLRRPIAITHFRKSCQRLHLFVDAIYGLSSSRRIIRGNVTVDIVEPAVSLFRPVYFCHERIRRAISSFETARSASESASPL